MNAFFLKSIRPYFNFPVYLPTALNSGLWLDEKIEAMQHSIPMEVTDYLERYPQTKHIDVYLNDINGIMRGKRLSGEHADAGKRLLLSSLRLFHGSKAKFPPLS
jgi:gamma-glutamylputrescine synthase